MLPSFLEAVLEAVRQKNDCVFLNRTIAIKPKVRLFFFDRLHAPVVSISMGLINKNLFIFLIFYCLLQIYCLNVYLIITDNNKLLLSRGEICVAGPTAERSDSSCIVGSRGASQLGGIF